MKVRSGFLLGLLALACVAPAALAQGFPAKTVRILSAYPSGISPDVSARIVADKLGRYWGQQVLVEPRPGANGFLAIGALKKAQPDGHELLLVGNAHLTINPALLKSVPYDVESDFVPVSLLYRAPFFLWVAASAPYKSVGDLVAAAKADPDKVSYSTPYVGSPPHLGGALLAHLTGTRMLPVHFKEGAQLYTSVANGDISFTISTAGSAASLVRAGRLRALAAASPARNPEAPDVPTVHEAGGPAGYEVDSWVALVAPRGTPADVAARIAGDIARALAEPDVRERYKGLGVLPAATAGPDLVQLIRADLKKNAEVVRRVGITPE